MAPGDPIDWSKYTPGDGDLGALEGVRDAVTTHGGFRNAVIFFVATWIIGGFLSVGRTVVGSILMAFDAVVVGFEAATASIVGGLESVGLPVLELASGVSGFIARLVVEAGPAAPVIAIGALVAIYVVWYRFLKAVLLEIPILGGALEFLGVDL